MELLQQSVSYLQLDKLQHLQRVHLEMYLHQQSVYIMLVVFSLFKFKAFWAIFLARVVLIPLISGLSYELIRFSAPRCRKGFFRFIVLPGLALQRITTKEPDDDQLEVAIHALKEALVLDGIKAREAQAAA